MDTFKKQVDKDAYRFERYAGEDRFVSYHAQLREIIDAQPSSLMEVGVGDQLVANYIKNNTSIAYTSVDFADDVGADVVASITELPFENNSFDAACAFEVLEHLPFEQFDRALAELARVARRHILISLPHFGPMISCSLKLPFVPHMRFAIKIPYPRQHAFNGQHYWEIGKKGYPTSLIREKLSEHGIIRKDFIPFNSPYHHFFVLELTRT